MTRDDDDDDDDDDNNNILLLLTAIGFLPGGSGYFTCTHMWTKNYPRINRSLMQSV